MTHSTATFLSWNYYEIVVFHDEFGPLPGPNTLLTSFLYFISCPSSTTEVLLTGASVIVAAPTGVWNLRVVLDYEVVIYMTHWLPLLLF